VTTQLQLINIIISQQPLITALPYGTLIFLLFLFCFLLHCISFQQLHSRVYLSLFPNLFSLSLGHDAVCECHSKHSIFSATEVNTFFNIVKPRAFAKGSTTYCKEKEFGITLW